MFSEKWYLININYSTGLDFIRAEGFVFSHVADEGLLNACAGELLRYRRRIGAEHIQIFTDIKKKHRYDDQIWVRYVQLAGHRALKEAQHSVVVSVLLCHMIPWVIFENGHYSAHALTSDVSIAETAQAAEFFLSDGVIVTGTATGAQADPEELRGESGSL